MRAALLGTGTRAGGQLLLSEEIDSKINRPKGVVVWLRRT